MKKIILINLILGFLLISCSTQDHRIEEELMECNYQSYSDNGIELKKLIVTYQNLLINEGILNNASGKSYRTVYEEIALGNELNKVPSKFFLSELRMLDSPDPITIKNCQNSVLADSTKYDLSKLKGLEQAMMNVQNSGDIQPSMVAQDILSVLSEEDFELDFYRLRTFLLFEMINPNTGIQSKIQELENGKSNYNLDKAINVHLDNQNQIFVNEVKVDIEKLKDEIRNYVKVNQSESVISTVNDREAMYRTYRDVQNAIEGEIDKLREELALEKFNLTLNELSERQLEGIKRTYPKNIVE